MPVEGVTDRENETMRKKSYIALAKLIIARQWKDRAQAGLFIHDLCDWMKDENPAFNKDKFMEYLNKNG